MRSREFLRLKVLAIAAISALAQPAMGQAEMSSREVVQPLSGGDVAALNRALQSLARNPRSVDALIAAGTASLQLGDIDAAIGFFGRADELSPGNASAKMGMAAGFLRSDRPIEALRLFAEAERAGASSDTLSGDRGLAYDLVGDNAHAQSEYRTALARREDDETRRRLALSQAIAGDKKGFEATLLPLLERRDLAAYRARAFGLAILGDAEEAQRIADAVMPRAMSQQIAPYFEHMPRLTKAQQAAAAHFGRFPQAGAIGRQDPRLARYSTSSSPPAPQIGTNLEPRGTPLGPQAETVPRQSRTSIGAPPVSRGAAPARQPDSPQIVSRPAVQSAGDENAGSISAPKDNLTRVITLQSGTEDGPKSLEEAFTGFDLAAPSATRRAPDAVDITSIEPVREIAPPPPPQHPRRIWVQVATGKDLAALKFDWRRLSRQAPDLLGGFRPHTVPWGVANRLLAGPYSSESDARDVVNALKEKGIDTFPYTSPEGQGIVELK